MFWYILFLSIFLIIGLCYFMGLVMIHIMNKKLKRPIVLESNQIEPFSDTIYKKKTKKHKKRKKRKKNSHDKTPQQQEEEQETSPENQDTHINDTLNYNIPQSDQPELSSQDDDISLNNNSADDSQDHSININKYNNVKLNLKIPLDKIIQSQVKQIMKEKKINIDHSHLDIDGTLKKYRNYYRNYGKYDKNKSDKKMLEQLQLTGYNINDY